MDIDRSWSTAWRLWRREYHYRCYHSVAAVIFIDRCKFWLRTLLCFILLSAVNQCTVKMWAGHVSYSASYLIVCYSCCTELLTFCRWFECEVTCFFGMFHFVSISCTVRNLGFSEPKNLGNPAIFPVPKPGFVSTWNRGFRAGNWSVNTY